VWWNCAGFVCLGRSKCSPGSRHRADLNRPIYTGSGPGSTTKGGALLYFAYTALIDPDRMAEVSREATFDFVAHLSEWGLTFPIAPNGQAHGRELVWDGALPSAAPESGSTVWGVVYAVPDEDRPALDAAEAAEGRGPCELEAIDRSGKRHAVSAYIADPRPSSAIAPSSDYVAIMVSGSRHWNLPAGWIVGLEDHLGSEL